MNPPTRILIVEDQYFVAIDCEMQLRRGGFECVGFARSAAEAREVAARERPDLVIMDIRLAGGSDGVAAAKSTSTSVSTYVAFLPARTSMPTCASGPHVPRPWDGWTSRIRALT